MRRAAVVVCLLLAVGCASTGGPEWSAAPVDQALLDEHGRLIVALPGGESPGCDPEPIPTVENVTFEWEGPPFEHFYGNGFVVFDGPFEARRFRDVIEDRTYDRGPAPVVEVHEERAVALVVTSPRLAPLELLVLPATVVPDAEERDEAWPPGHRLVIGYNSPELGDHPRSDPGIGTAFHAFWVGADQSVTTYLEVARHRIYFPFPCRFVRAAEDAVEQANLVLGSPHTVGSFLSDLADGGAAAMVWTSGGPDDVRRRVAALRWEQTPVGERHVDLELPLPAEVRAALTPVVLEVRVPASWSGIDVTLCSRVSVGWGPACGPFTAADSALGNLLRLPALRFGDEPIELVAAGFPASAMYPSEVGMTLGWVDASGLGDHEVIEVVVADVFDDATSIAEVEAIAEANPGVDPLVADPAG